MKSQKYMVTDGKLVLILRTTKEGGFTVTAPFEQGLITEAKTLPEAYAMAYDAKAALAMARKKLAKSSRKAVRKYLKKH